MIPSPALGLTAVVTKGEAGTDVALDGWDNIGWYTNSETDFDADMGARTTHKFKHRHSTDGETWGDYSEIAIAGAAKGSVTVSVMGLDASDVYSFQVVTVKTTYVDSNNDGDVDAPVVKESAASQIDVVGPQTLTAENPFSLPVAVAYSLASSDDTAILEDPVVDASDEDNVMLNFNPLAEGETTVELEQAHGSHTFPVEILSAASAAPDGDGVKNTQPGGRQPAA